MPDPHRCHGNEATILLGTLVRHVMENILGKTQHAYSMAKCKKDFNLKKAKFERVISGKISIKHFEDRPLCRRLMNKMFSILTSCCQNHLMASVVQALLHFALVILVVYTWRNDSDIFCKILSKSSATDLFFLFLNTPELYFKNNIYGVISQPEYYLAKLNIFKILQITKLEQFYDLDKLSC